MVKGAITKPVCLLDAGITEMVNPEKDFRVPSLPWSLDAYLDIVRNRRNRNKVSKTISSALVP